MVDKKKKRKKLSFDLSDVEDENIIPVESVNKIVYDYLQKVKVFQIAPYIHNFRLDMKIQDELCSKSNP